MNCIFCKIIGKEIPNYTVYEDESVLAFLDVFPCMKGHTVVIPKKHVSKISELNDEEWGKLMLGVKRANARVQEVLKPDATNIGINNGEEAGQAVPHVHWHIFPRWKGDGGGSVHSIIKKPQEKIEVKEVAKLFE